MSNAVVVIGTQWGDEGKGKITNYLSEQADVVVRYQGGDNAGHTIKFNNKTYALHIIPSGVFNPNIINVLGNGVVFNPKTFIKELDELIKQGFPCENIKISDRAHVIFDYHQTIDGILEDQLGSSKIGTTKKGIGPVYTDKISRRGIRIIDFIGPDFKEKYYAAIKSKNKILKDHGLALIDAKDSYQEYQEIAKKIMPYVADTIYLLNSYIKLNKKILFEGAQGTMLDIDFGTYPFVTSSNPTSGGASTGTGIGPTNIKEIIGVVKAYSTRVGSGAFPSEFFDTTANQIREVGNEYGTTTKRPRRIGWFDGVLLKYSVMVNGITGLSLMLLDVLSGIPKIKICIGYKLNGMEICHVPANVNDFEKCQPIYDEIDGWMEDISNIKEYDHLPLNAKRYISYIEKVTGVPVVIISVGPDKDQTIIRKKIFA